MNDSNRNLEDTKEKAKNLEIRGDLLKKSITNKINLLSTNEMNGFIKNLSRPQFLGSIHLSKESNYNQGAINDLMKGELELKLSKSLKNPVLNPITRYLVFVMILFNLLWFLFSIF
jgi:hypothetical protein